MKISIIISGLLGAIVLIIIGGIIFFKPEVIQKPLNAYFPKADRTLKISEAEMRKGDGYVFKTALEKGVVKITASGLRIGGDDYEASVMMPHEIVSSTVPQSPLLDFKVIKNAGVIYVQDPYDTTFHLSPTGIFQKKQLSFLDLGFSDIVNLLIDKEKGLELIANPEGFTVSFSSDDFPIPYFPEFKKAKITLIIDKKTYLAKNLNIEWHENNSVVAKLSETFEKPNNPIVIKKPENINQFGDFLARESVYLRTDGDGIYDNTWLDWENKYFDCQRCVNKYWDSDGDGLVNIKEFIFNTDPKKRDSDGDGVNDYKELFGKTNPTNDDKLSLNYSEAADYLLSGGEPTTDTGVLSSKFIKKAFVRDSYAGIDNLTIPKDAKSLVLSFILEGNEEGSTYSTFFFDDALIFKASPISGHKVTDPFNKDYVRTESIPIGQFAGKKVRFVHILNSFGKPGGQVMILLNKSSGTLGSYIETTSNQKIPLIKSKAQLQEEIANLFINELAKALSPLSQPISLNKQWQLSKSYNEPRTGVSFQLPSEFILEPSSFSGEFVFKTNAPQKGVWEVVIKFDGSDKSPIDGQTYMDYLKTQKVRQIGLQSLPAPWLSSKPDKTIAGRQVKSLTSSIGDTKQLAAESVIEISPVAVMHVMVIGFDAFDKVRAASGGMGYSDEWFSNLKDLNELIISSIKN